MLERLKEVFEKSGLSKTQIANKLDVTPQYIWKLMNQQGTEPSERIILSVLRAFPEVSEKWLRTGEGEMESVEHKIAKMASSLLDSDDDVRAAFIDVINGLSHEDLLIWYRIGKNIVNEVEKTLPKE